MKRKKQPSLPVVAWLCGESSGAALVSLLPERNEVEAELVEEAVALRAVEAAMASKQLAQLNPVIETHRARIALTHKALVRKYF